MFSVIQCYYLQSILHRLIYHMTHLDHYIRQFLLSRHAATRSQIRAHSVFNLLLCIIGNIIVHHNDNVFVGYTVTMQYLISVTYVSLQIIW